VLYSRDRGTVLIAALTGHHGPAVFRSQDLGRTWQEASRPPAFPKAEAPEAKREDGDEVTIVCALSGG
jgi:hypothetical protein